MAQDWRDERCQSSELPSPPQVLQHELCSGVADAAQPKHYMEGAEASKAQPGKDQKHDEKFSQHMQCGQGRTTKMTAASWSARTLMHPCVFAGRDTEHQLHDTDVPE